MTIEMLAGSGRSAAVLLPFLVARYPCLMAPNPAIGPRLLNNLPQTQFRTAVHRTTDAW